MAYQYLKILKVLHIQMLCLSSSNLMSWMNFPREEWPFPGRTKNVMAREEVALAEEAAFDLPLGPVVKQSLPKFL